ncbi:MAG: hypothetical protein AB1540_16025 [Bdellovibrionota bacterium]
MLQFVVNLIALSVLLVFSNGCGKPEKKSAPVEQVLPNIPTNTQFGSLYPTINAHLSQSNPNVVAAVRETQAWAVRNLSGFDEGACAPLAILYDADFSRTFGKTTLGVTLPWMQIYVRDGKRSRDPFFWSDATLLVSTVLHEYVHSVQRVRQANRLLGVRNGCESARQTLLSRRITWSMGFEEFQSGRPLGSGYSAAERTMLYEWSSPILRARDEVEAALLTVRWMAAHPEELSHMTLGGANNWTYALHYLSQMQQLSNSNCFSPDETAYQEELRVYQVEFPAYTAELEEHETAMRAFFERNALPAPITQLPSTGLALRPAGRAGISCSASALRELPRFDVINELLKEPYKIEMVDGDRVAL